MGNRRLANQGAEMDEDGSSSIVVERDSATNTIVALHLYNAYVDKPFTVRTYSTVMVQGDGGRKYVAYIREFVDKSSPPKSRTASAMETADDEEVYVRVVWFYRQDELGCSPPKDAAVRQARLVDYPGRRKRAAVVDHGWLKEIYFSNHLETEDTSAMSILHPIKVWLVDSLEPLVVQPPPGRVPPDASAAAGATANAAAAAAPDRRRPPLLPGFVCRYFYNAREQELVPLSRVAAGGYAVDGWVKEDLEELRRLSQQQLVPFRAEWLKRWEQRQATLAAAAAAAPPPPASAAATS